MEVGRGRSREVLSKLCWYQEEGAVEECVGRDAPEQGRSSLRSKDAGRVGLRGEKETVSVEHYFRKTWPGPLLSKRRRLGRLREAEGVYP